MGSHMPVLIHAIREMRNSNNAAILNDTQALVAWAQQKWPELTRYDVARALKMARRISGFGTGKPAGGFAVLRYPLLTPDTTATT